mmetsp:Transcript_47149/g.86542  ORF Transcript_47149/g.86542 Transcript_47149/m.86542 type:complete len:82 (+) Transcript_47149:554-799(+)
MSVPKSSLVRAQNAVEVLIVRKMASIVVHHSCSTTFWMNINMRAVHTRSCRIGQSEGAHFAIARTVGWIVRRHPIDSWSGG